ncbi:hypothetical protein ACFE04_006030 [Oxalis oulophora]
MAQDSEKRIQSIMDKLFHAPKSIPNRSSSSGVQSSSGGKKHQKITTTTGNNRSNGLLQHSSSYSPAEAPLCRPWDRTDLITRLSTFKSMTWFAKPKVVSAVNCARRGWVNIEMDIIACESCGARLLFSTPSSWSQQQVEKAALVFSLKLDSGHKLPCPWMNNACEETLAQFPPAIPENLVDKFRERSSALSQLSSLPIISSSTIEDMKSPQLEEFLKQSPSMEHGNASVEVCETESSGNYIESDSATSYYQAQKLLSLCGWEPRLLSYMVDGKEGANPVVKDANILQSSSVAASGQNAITESDLKSVVLDCKLCGACVGLWAFSTVTRPLEFFRLVGQTELGGENNSRADDPANNNALLNTSESALSKNGRLPNLSRTIAGGPPPAKHNFKATISLPVIGQNLRAKFLSDFGLNSTEHITLKRKRDDLEHCTSTSDDQEPGLTDGISEEVGSIQKESMANFGSGNSDVQAVRELNSVVSLTGAEKDKKHLLASQEMKFDPIKQHRHFCPWIIPTGGRQPGWQQTLSALLRQKSRSHPSPSGSPPSGSIIKVDDPICSIRKLFMSPPTKRMKSTLLDEAKSPGGPN